MTAKRRLSVSVDADLIEAGQQAVSAGQAGNVSAWVNEAMRQQAAHDARLRSLDEFLGAFEAEHGEITPEDMAAADWRASAAAVVVRGGPSGATARRTAASR